MGDWAAVDDATVVGLAACEHGFVLDDDDDDRVPCLVGVVVLDVDDGVFRGNETFTGLLDDEDGAVDFKGEGFEVVTVFAAVEAAFLGRLTKGMCFYRRLVILFPLLPQSFPIPSPKCVLLQLLLLL